MQIFYLIDTDHSGLLQGPEVDAMFERICGRRVNTGGGGGAYNLTTFIQTAEAVNRRYPQFHVAQNLLKFLHDSMGSTGAAVETDSFNLNNCQRLLNVLDQDRSGNLELQELFNMFQYMGISTRQFMKQAAAHHGCIKDANELQELLRDLDENNPHLGIDDKVVRFIAQTSSGKPDMSHPQAVPASSGTASKRKKALLVGINYIGSRNELQGCINDVQNQYEVITENLGFPRDRIMLLSDDQDPSRHPTKSLILGGIKWLLEGAMAGDLLFFHYSGHGSQVPDRSGDEPDGKDECFVPLDFKSHHGPDGMITDDVLKQFFFDRVPQGVHVVCIFDCCHSGSMSDLACIRSSSHDRQVPRCIEPSEEMKAEIDQIAAKRAAEGTSRATKFGWDGAQDKFICTFSGCQDNQTSADVYVDGMHQGAFTWGFLKALNKTGFDATFEELHCATKKNLRRKRYDQIPTVASTCDAHLHQRYCS